MITNISSRHADLKQSVKSYVEKKVSRLTKYHNRITEIEVVLDTEGTKSTIEIIVHTGDNAKPFVLHHSDDDIYACIDGAVDRSERQLLKHKEQAKNHKGKTGAGEASAEIMGE